jgi:hypothetical protein
VFQGFSNLSERRAEWQARGQQGVCNHQSPRPAFGYYDNVGHGKHRGVKENTQTDSDYRRHDHRSLSSGSAQANTECNEWPIDLVNQKVSETAIANQSMPQYQSTHQQENVGE